MSAGFAAPGNAALGYMTDAQKRFVSPGGYGGRGNMYGDSLMNIAPLPSWETMFRWEMEKFERSEMAAAGNRTRRLAAVVAVPFVWLILEFCLAYFGP